MNSYIEDAVASLEKSNSDLEPDLLSPEEARETLAAYARAEKLIAFGKTMLARRVSDAHTVARLTGTSVGRAKATLETGETLARANVVRDAFRAGRVSGDQAAEIARAEAASPEAAEDLLRIAATESHQVLRERSRKVVLEAEAKRGLGQRQRRARSARVHTDELGMINVNLRLQPHIGTPLAARAEAEAARRYRAAKRAGAEETFPAHLADAYAAMLAGSATKGPAKRPELVVLVSHGVAQRGWNDVREGEVCKVPGVGPIDPQVARDIAEDAFLTGVVYDGKDLRQIKRWTRHIPSEVRIALELGPPGDLDGVRCSDCGSRFHVEFDHDEPLAAGGPTSLANLPPRCWSCHSSKTARDRAAGKLRPRAP